jgi:hypothetical protein
MKELVKPKRNKVSKKRLQEWYFSNIERKVALDLEIPEVWYDGYQFTIDDKGKFKLLNITDERVQEFIDSKLIFIPSIFDYVDESNLITWMFTLESFYFCYSFVGDGLLGLETDSLFSNANLDYVSLKSCKSLSSNCFNSCVNLSEINIVNVEKIGQACFYDCKSLVNINIPNVRIIQNQAFMKCIQLCFHSQEFPKLIQLGEQAFCGSSIKSMTAPKLKEIEKESFMGSRLTYFSGDRVLRIQEMAFYDSELADIHVPNVHYLGYRSFGYAKIKEFKSSSVSSVSLPFFECPCLKVIELSGIKRIYGNIAYYCIRLEKLVLNSCVKQEGGDICLDCNALDAVYLTALKHFNIFSFDWKNRETKIYLSKNVILEPKGELLTSVGWRLNQIHYV